MSRLVDPIPEDAQLTKQAKRDNYLNRVAKYVPSEVLAAYIAINGLIPGLPDSWRFWAFFGNFGLGAVLTPTYLSKIGRGHPKRLQMKVATVAFALWSYAVGSSGGLFGDHGLRLYNGALASILLIAFSLISGALYPRPNDK